MRNLIGGSCILLGGFWLRAVRLQEQRRRREALNSLLMALRRIRDGIRLARTPLPALISSAAEPCGNECGRFFSAASERLRRGVPLKNAWAEALSMINVPECIYAVLSELGQTLSGDEEAVLAALALAVHHLEQIQETMEQQRTQEARQITAVSLSASVLLLILFL